ncbi:hypothetical protein TVAG_428670 [Trichomonas vaginalis G3]|uniref:DnaK protein n=1 Tax=Trichomonas vaginalis (strain ATCC PRA-98 / G3) TaxID=412133 RepID=A2FJ57_TRIV3|nr:unfolded protein binding [Trichomonas vaginalis G3]EAX95064.1 hypothetical protein TVAG_428670 [Trichomonas vaginalis G3]KAI5484694.1 unfolded protein binding [Trichomonas vaginalis G3]|eukprot:XP_001307994.1 hypothetical protein [Trichomonas vaginalis G3]
MKYPKIDIEACKSILVLDAEKAKKSISNGHKSSTISLRIENEIIEYTFMKNKLEKILDPLIQRTITIIRRLLNSHKDAKVESILLVGGTSMIYYVKESLELEFEDDNIRVINSVDPLTAVAIGAAQKAFFEFYKKQEEMNGNQIVLPKNFPKKMIEAVSITYGFECYIHGTYETTMKKMIMKDTKLPSEPITTITSTSFDNQEKIEYDILQGESLEDSRKIGEYTLTGLSGNKKAGKEKARVTFQVDEQNCLHVKFQLLNIEGAKEESMDIDLSKFLPSYEVENDLTKLTKQQIKESRDKIGADSRNYDEELGELQAIFEEYQNKARKGQNKDAVKFCTEKLNFIDEAYYIEDQDSIENAIEEIQKEKRIFEQKYKNLCN